MEELEDRGFVLRVVGGARGLVCVERIPDLGRQRCAQAKRLLAPERGTRQRRREDEAHEPVGLSEGVLLREHPAPGVPEQMHAVEAERVADVRELGEEELDGPERRIGRLRRVARPELVVEDDAPLVSELLERGEPEVRRAGAAVQAEEWHARPVAGRAEPRLVAAERDTPFLDLHGYSGVT